MNSEERMRLIKAFMDVRKCFQRVAGYGELTQAEFFVLKRIKAEHEGKIDNLGEFKAVKISQYLSMLPPAVSRIFNSLESRGYIVRSINQENKRSVILSLTESGESALENAEREIDSLLDRVFSDLGETKSVKLLIILEDLRAVFDREGYSKKEVE